MEFPKPKLKRKRGAAGLGSLPVEKEAQETSSKCTGVLVGGSVLVTSDITKLLRYGVYGQAAFSGSSWSQTNTRADSFTVPLSDEYCRRRGSRKRTRLLQDDPLFQREVLESEEDISEEKKKKTRLLLHAEEKQEECSTSQEQTIISTGTEGMISKGDNLQSTSEERSIEDTECGGCLDTSRTNQKEEISVPTNDEATLSAMIEDPTECLPVTEPLCLSSEETFYLMAELECLDVYSSTDTAAHCLTVEELWKQLCQNCRRFPFIYTAYQHYRRKGWVPKSGAKFGVDFTLYKDGPEYYHSSYAILICEQFNEMLETAKEESTVDSKGMSIQGVFDDEEQWNNLGHTDGLLRWIDVIAHSRVSESTAKELILCYITTPSGYDKSFSYECVKHMNVSEVLVTRWLPEKDR